MPDCLADLKIRPIPTGERKHFCSLMAESLEFRGLDGRHHQKIDLISVSLGDVTDHKKRLLTCVLAMDISKADGDISDSEMALLRFMMQRWNISLDDLHHTFTR